MGKNENVIYIYIWLGKAPALRLDFSENKHENLPQFREKIIEVMNWHIYYGSLLIIQRIQKNTQQFQGRLYSLFSRVQKCVIHVWKLTFMKSLCAYSHHVNRCSIWDPSTL
jgi:hypothetical protein